MRKGNCWGDLNWKADEEMLRLLEGEESAPIYGQSPMGLECKQSPVRLGPQFKLYSCLFPKLRLCLESNLLAPYHSDCWVDI